MNPKKEYEVVKHTQMDFLEVFFVEMTRRNPHGHDDFEIGIVVSGELTLFVGGSQLTLRAGDVYAVNRFQVHSLSSAFERTLILAFQIHGAFFRHAGQRMMSLRLGVNAVQDESLCTTLRGKLFECARFYFAGEQLSELKCYALVFDALWEIFTRLPKVFVSLKEASRTKRESIRVNRVTDYISEHYAEPISLSDIASLEGISPCHASHFFKSALGVSFQEYLSQIRFEKACPLVGQTDLNLLDVCMETGFSSTRYLNRAFQNKLGCDAVEYRKRAAKPPLGCSTPPAGNAEHRLSFEQGRQLIARLTASQDPAGTLGLPPITQRAPVAT